MHQVFASASYNAQLCSTTMSAKRPRLLCLHGSRSNAEVTEMQCTLLGLDEFGQGPCECTYLTAPHETEEGFDKDIKNPRSWWIGGEMESGLRSVVEHVMENGPYDGVYGFSQGSSVITILSDQKVWHQLSGGSTQKPWRYAIFGCGTDYLLGQPSAPHVETPLDMPSLHVLGAQDHILADSKSLTTRYKDPTILTINSGHAIPITLQDGSPGSTAVLQQVQSFIRAHDSASA